MVEYDFIKSIINDVKQILLEKYDAQDLILLIIPEADSFYEIVYSLAISSNKFDRISIKQIIDFVFNKIDKTKRERIYKIDILNSSENLVNTLRLMFPVFNEMIEIYNIRLGGFYIEKAYLFKQK
jgi:hypothetical protein